MWGGLITHAGQNADPAFRSNVVQAFKRHCDEALVVPYHVPVGGFMISPVIDIDVGTIYEIGERMEKAIQRTKAEVGWKPISPTTTGDALSSGPKAIASASTLDLAGLAEMADKGLPRVIARTPSTVTLAESAKSAVKCGSLHLAQDLGNDKCVPYLHVTKCCTECGSFVCPDVRAKFRRSSSNVSLSIHEDEDALYDLYGEASAPPGDTAVSDQSSDDDAATF